MKTKIICAMALAGFANLGQAVELFNNGAVVNSAGLSILSSPDTTLGATSAAPLGIVLADNFTVGGVGWNVSSLDFYAYQTNAVGFTFTSVAYSIVKGTDINTGLVVASGTVAAINDGLAGYRVTDTTTTNTARAIYKIGADIPDITLTAGSYFVTWGLTGTGVSGPFVPPIPGSTATGLGNAMQTTTGANSFLTLTDGGSFLTMEMPFSITGTVVAVPEPASVALMLVGALAVGGMARRRRG